MPPNRDKNVCFHKITYNGNGATGGSTAETSFTYGNTASVRSNGFTRTNYSFTGWNTKADGSGTPYAAGASYKAAANLTLYAQWKLEGYTLKWTGRLSQYGSYLGTESNVFVKTEKPLWKRIIYTDTIGKTAYADPYIAGSITIKAGTAVTLQMVAGSSDFINCEIGWYVGSYVGHDRDGYYSLMSSSWTPSGSYTLTTKFDLDDYYNDGYGYYGWYVSAS